MRRSARAGSRYHRRFRLMAPRGWVGLRLGPPGRRRVDPGHRARISGGVNWIDTAAIYGLGHSEKCGPRVRAFRQRTGRWCSPNAAGPRPGRFYKRRPASSPASFRSKWSALAPSRRERSTFPDPLARRRPVYQWRTPGREPSRRRGQGSGDRLTTRRRSFWIVASGSAMWTLCSHRSHDPSGSAHCDPLGRRSPAPKSSLQPMASAA